MWQAPRVIDAIGQARQRRGLAGAGGSDDQQQAVRLLAHLEHARAASPASSASGMPTEIARNAAAGMPRSW